MPHLHTQLHLTFIHLLRTVARLLHRGRAAVGASCLPMVVRHPRLGPAVEVEEWRLLMAEHRLLRGPVAADSCRMVVRLLRHGPEGAEGSLSSMKSRFA
ncbi:MAG TPA: hypothetical protein VJR23_07055 [Candidatus Acidoferrales bacterium]|nr:hypothetical protein [Candidatus Acidoferrales bacterium]